MSNYQFIVFSEKGHNRSKTKDRPVLQSLENDEIVRIPTNKEVIRRPTDDDTLLIHRDSKKKIHIESNRLRKRQLPDGIHQNELQYQQDSIENASASKRGGKSTTGKAKIPRPANAFMLFANDWRKKLASENPRESNKDISVRLGTLWKNLEKHEKEKYFTMAREVDAEHKRKYPDYVYNPKEARLRKAMREQNRELSRQSILSGSTSSSAPDNTSTTTSAIGESRSVSTTFTDRPMTCSLGPASMDQNLSPLPENSPYISGRIVNPWFPITHTSPAAHLNSMLPHRMMQAHQRTFDKTKEAMRKQASLAECSEAFSTSSTASCYPGNFSIHESSAQSMNTTGNSDTRTNGSNLESNDYCGIGEFTDGQKWHPYQNGPTQYHSRSGPITKLSNRHSTIQNVNHVNNHVQGPWNQFCGVPMSPMAAQNPLIPNPRQMVLLQQQQERQCSYPDDISMPYVTSKIDLGHRMQSGYPQSNYQKTEKSADDLSKWQNGNNDRPMNSMMMQHAELLVKDEQSQQHAKTEERVKDYDNTTMQKSKIISKQPLPGFHQAFGSTEIGRFSRTEFFANMVNENGPIPDGYIFPHMLPYQHKKPLANDLVPANDCYWIGPIMGFPMSNMSDLSKYITFMESPSEFNQEWMYPGHMMPHNYSPMNERSGFPFPENYNHPNYPTMSLIPKKITNDTNDSSTRTSSFDPTTDVSNHTDESDENEKIEEEEEEEEAEKVLKNEEEENDSFINVDDTE